jgi:hypothetical protein
MRSLYQMNLEGFEKLKFERDIDWNELEILVANFADPKDISWLLR